jgi:hypothetical protein
MLSFAIGIHSPPWLLSSLGQGPVLLGHQGAGTRSQQRLARRSPRSGRRALSRKAATIWRIVAPARVRGHRVLARGGTHRAPAAQVRFRPLRALGRQVRFPGAAFADLPLQGRKVHAFAKHGSPLPMRRALRCGQMS